MRCEKQQKKKLDGNQTVLNFYYRIAREIKLKVLLTVSLFQPVFRELLRKRAELLLFVYCVH